MPSALSSHPDADPPTSTAFSYLCWESVTNTLELQKGFKLSQKPIIFKITFLLCFIFRVDFECF